MRISSFGFLFLGLLLFLCLFPKITRAQYDTLWQKNFNGNDTAWVKITNSALVTKYADSSGLGLSYFNRKGNFSFYRISISKSFDDLKDTCTIQLSIIPKSISWVGPLYGGAFSKKEKLKEYQAMVVSDSKAYRYTYSYYDNDFYNNQSCNHNIPLGQECVFKVQLIKDSVHLYLNEVYLMSEKRPKRSLINSSKLTFGWAVRGQNDFILKRIIVTERKMTP